MSRRCTCEPIYYLSFSRSECFQCPHDGACPLHVPGITAPTICSFSQRLQRPPFLRKTKHARAGHEDVGYCYVVIRRGRRPGPNSSINRAQGMRSEDGSDESADRVTESRSLEEQMRSDSYRWPRLVFPPLKRSGHVIMDSCTYEGLSTVHTFFSI